MFEKPELSIERTPGTNTMPALFKPKDGIINQKLIAYRAPISGDVLADPQLFGHLAAMLLSGARLEASKACEGRPYTIDRMRLSVVTYDQPFTDESDPNFIRNMLTAQLDLTVTPAG